VVWFLTAAIVAGVYQRLSLILIVTGVLVARSLWVRTRAARLWPLLAAACALIGWSALSTVRRGADEVARVAAGRGAALVALEGHVASFPQASPFGTSFLYETSIEGRRVRLVMRAAFFDANYGDAFACRARLGGGGNTDYLLARGAAGTARVRLRDTREIRPASRGRLHQRALWSWHRTVRTRLSRAMSGDAALALALLLGERGFLDHRVRDAVVRLGIAHLLALSGMHLTTVAALALVAARSFARGRDLLVLAALSAYVGMVGDVASLTRAYLMAVFIVLARAVARPVSAIDALGRALLVMLLVSPTAILSVGLQLSFAATVAVLAALQRFPLLRAGMRGRGEGGGRIARRVGWVLLAALLISVAVEVVIAPLQFHHFGRMSAVGPLATALFVLPVTFLQVLGMAVAALAGVPLMGDALVACLGACSRAATEAVLTAAAVAPQPLAGDGPAALPYYAALLLVWRFSRRRWAWVAAATLLVVAFRGVLAGMDFW